MPVSRLSVVVTLAERQYTVKELPKRKNMEWRQALKDSFSGLADALSSAPDIEVDSKAGLEQVTALVRTLTSHVFGSIDLMCDLLFSYSSELAADRDRIEVDGYDSEVVDAFVQVLQLAFPFGPVINLVIQAVERAGQQAKQT